MEKDKSTNEDTINEIVEESEEIEIQNETSRINEIEIELQKIEISLDVLEEKMVNEDKQEQYMDEYNDLREKYNDLLKERKLLLKSNSNWEKVPLWIIFYAIFQAIILMPIPAVFAQIWGKFAIWVAGIFESQIESIFINAPKFVFIIIMSLIVYALPLINIFITWILYVNVVKKDFDKLVFRYLWLVQGLLTTGIAIYLFIEIIYKNFISV